MNHLQEINVRYHFDADLIRIITGVNKSRIPNMPLSEMMSCSDAELSQWLTVPQITKLRASFEIGARSRYSLVDQIRSPQDAVHFLTARYAHVQQECFVVMSLNTKNFITNVTELYRGSVNSSLIRVAEVFREAIRTNSCAIIVGHNHPSGDATPSSDDVSTTKSLREAGQLLDIDLLDHLIIGNNGKWTSLRERGLGF